MTAAVAGKFLIGMRQVISLTFFLCKVWLVFVFAVH